MPKWIIIILDENDNYFPITTIGPYESEQEACDMANEYFDRMDALIPEFAQGYGYEIRPIKTFDDAMTRVVTEISLMARKDETVRKEWDEWMNVP